MDIKKERECFEKWFSENNESHFMQFSILDDIYQDKHSQTCWKAWQEAKSQVVPECKWNADDDGVYNTECGNKFVLNCDTPHNNGMFHCCYCGGKLIEAQEQSHDN